MGEKDFTSKSTDIILLTIVAILLLCVGIPTVQRLTGATSNIFDENCLIDPYIEYQDTLTPGEKPSIKINFSLNPSCSDVTGYKVYTTYNLFDGKYNNHVRRYYVEYDRKLKTRLAKSSCIYPAFNKDGDACYLYEEGGAIIKYLTWEEAKEIIDNLKEGDANPTKSAHYTWDDIKDIEYKGFKPLYKYVIKQYLNKETCQFESTTDTDALCYFFKDELIGDFKVRTENNSQEAIISNLEFNTTYQIDLALVRGKEEGQKITVNREVHFSSSSNTGVQNFNKTVRDDQITKDKAYHTFFSKPKFKKNSKLIAPTRFNNESSHVQSGNTAAILRLEDTLSQDFGYAVYYSDIGRGYSYTNQMIQPEELFIYKNCKLDLDVLSDTYNGDGKVYIICNETDPKIIELIKLNSETASVTNCIKTSEGTLRCVSPDYGISTALLGKAKNKNFTVNVNRADKVKTATSVNIAWLLLQNGYYKNEPYPLGFHLRDIITEMVAYYIQGKTVDDLRENLTNKKKDLPSKNKLKDYPNYKQFQVNVLSKIYDKAISATTKTDGEVSEEYIKNYITAVFSLIKSLCNSDLDDNYCTGIDSTGAINSIKEISSTLKNAFLQSYDQENKTWKWNLYADSIVLENMADFELFQMGLLNDFISPKSKITAIINGGEAFSMGPSQLPLYNGKDKYGNPYSDYTNKNCSNNTECCNKREEWIADLSENFRRQQRVLTDKFSSFLPETPFRKPYIFYLTGQQFPSKSRRNDIGSLYAEIANAAFDLICTSKYLTNSGDSNSAISKNNAYPSLISDKIVRKKYLKRGEEYYNYFFSTYQGTIYLHLNGAIYGYLKLGYMMGSIGWCNYYHANSFTEEPTLTDLPASVKDTLAVSKVSAEFSYLDDFLKNSQVITINNQIAEQTDLSSADNVITIVRKEYGKQHWLALGVSKDFVTRDLTLNINDDQIDITASPAGSLYEIAFVNEYGEILEDGNSNGEQKIRLIDDAKTFSLMSENDESLINMKQFGDFYLPIVIDPVPTSTPAPKPTQVTTTKCHKVSLTNVKTGISNNSYANFVLKQVKKNRIRRKKQLKKAKKFINSFNENVNSLPETVEICPNQYQSSFAKYKDNLDNAKSELEKIFKLTSKAIKQVGKKKKKLNKKNKNFYNEKLSLLNKYQEIVQ